MSTLSTIASLRRVTGDNPTLKEVADERGVAKTTIVRSVRRLIRKGLASANPFIHRSLKVTRKGMYALADAKQAKSSKPTK